MKKIIMYILTLTMVFVLCACGSEDSNSPIKPNIDTDDKLDNTDIDDILNVGKDLSENEMLSGLWFYLYEDSISLDCAIFTSDGYAFLETYNTDDEEDIDWIRNIIECMRDDKSSNAIEKILEYEFEEYYSIDELYQSTDVGKYDVKNGVVTINYSDGDIETASFDPIASVFKYSFSDKYTFQRYDFNSDDTFRFFLGNWNYEQTELISYNYVEDSRKHYDSGALFFGEDFRVNESDGDIGGWGYNNGRLEIEGIHYNVIKLSQSWFILYAEYEHESYTRYVSAIFSRV